MGELENEPLKQIARLALAEGESLALLRLEQTLEIAITEECVWLRGDFAGCENRLIQLPVVEIFEELPEGMLGFSGSRIPVRKIPAGLEWQPIAEAIRLRPDRSAFPGTAVAEVALCLVRSRIIRPTGMLGLRLEEFSEWVKAAPAIRFQNLTFACSADGQVLVRGHPVPPLPGRRYVLDDGLAIPAGFALDPPLPAAVVRSLVDAKRPGVIRFEENADVDVIDDSLFVPVTRAGVRMTFKREATDAV